MTSWKLFHSTADVWEAMYEDCARAKKSIDLEQYIFTIDEQAEKFYRLFEKRSRAGVRIRLLGDMVGSSSFYYSPIVTRLSEAGIQVSFFNPISPWRVHNFTSWFFRDHRKILIVDGKVGYVGGVNFGSHMKSWRDTQLRIEGAAVGQLARAFRTLWERTQRRRKREGMRPDPSQDGFQLVTNAPRPRHHWIYKALKKAIAGARTRVLLTTPYFVPSIPFLRAIRSAARRGVDVRLIIPKVSDIPILDRARESYIGSVLRAGVHVYHYAPGFIHAKIAIVDGTWATVGSMNLDNLAFWYNHEANAIITEPTCIQSLEEQFSRDLEGSREVLFSEWDSRPRIDKFLELLTWPLHSFF